RPFICHRWSCLRCLCWGCHGSPFIWFSRSARLLQRHSFIFGNARGQQEPHVSRAAFFVFVGVVIEARFLLVTPERGQEPQRRARMPRAMQPALLRGTSTSRQASHDSLLPTARQPKAEPV